MNKDQLKGALKQAAGKVQEQAGKVIGSRRQRAKGLAKQVAGKVQGGYGDVKQTLKSTDQS